MYGDKRAFAFEWYAQQRDSYFDQLPSEANDLFKGARILRLAALKGDVGVLGSVSRAFNDTHVSNFVFVAPQTLDWLTNAADNEYQGAVLEEIDEFSDALQDSMVFASSEIVLAVNPQFARRFDHSPPSFDEVLLLAGHHDDFRWIRPRGDTPGGRQVDFAIAEILGLFDKNADSDAFHRARLLSERVAQYVPDDQTTLKLAVRKGQWNVDAFVCRRHAIPLVSDALPPDQRPIVAAYRSPLRTLYALRFSNIPRVAPYSEVIVFLNSDAGRDAVNRSGLTWLDQLERDEAAASSGRVAAAMAQLGLGRSFEKPVAVYLVADTSSSMGGPKLEAAKLAMSAFLGQLSEQRGDMVGLITFGDIAEHVVQIGKASDRLDLIEDRIHRLTAGGQTSLLDAIGLAWRSLIEWSRYIRVIVVLTDGHENASHEMSEERLLASMSKAPDTPLLFLLGYGVDADYLLLSRLAGGTRGEVVEGSIRTISQLFNRIALLL